VDPTWAANGENVRFGISKEVAEQNRWIETLRDHLHLGPL
jgi:hypothetical protein